MAQSVNVNFRMDEGLKKNLEDICQRMGMNLTTMLTISCTNRAPARRSPSDMPAEADPFYSESNVRELKRRIDAIKAGTAKLEEHELIEVE